jgi:calmodulin
MADGGAPGGQSKDENWFTETKKKIREAFQLFDKDRKGCVIQEEVSTIMRYLGAYPTERAMVKEILPDMMEDEPTAFVTYERFEAKMLEILASGEWEPDSEDVLLQAFRVFDPEGNGYIEAHRMRDLLITKGTPFREKEIDNFMSVAKDLETGHIYYEDYVAHLTADQQDG